MNNIWILFFVLLYLINPFVGMVILCLLKIVNNQKDKISDTLLFLFITIYACLIQSTRIWNIGQPSDWYNDGYWGIFSEISKHSFYEFILSTDKEPIWRLLNYIGYYITDGNYYVFINSIAIAIIFITCYSIFIYWKKTKADILTLIASLFLFIFFTEYWWLLNSMTRQFFSISLISYVYVIRVTDNKIKWWLLISAGLIHTMSFIFIAFVFIKPLHSIIRKKQFLSISLIFIGISFVISNISIFKNIFAGIDFILYGMERLESASNPMDQNFLDPIAVYLTAAIIILICIIMNYYSKYNKTNVFYTNVLMITMLICASIIPLAPEIMGRIYVSRFYLFPFVLPYFMINKKIIHIVYSMGIIAFFSFRFFTTFDAMADGIFFPKINNFLVWNIADYFIR